jgi:hypothetical protein
VLVVLMRLSCLLCLGTEHELTLVGTALMMQVPTQSRILGYPAIAMVFFLLAALGGAALMVSIVRTDSQIARRESSDRDPRS